MTCFWNSFPANADQPYDWYLPEWIKGVKTDDGRFIAGGIVDVKIWNTLPQSAAEPADLLLSNSWYNNGDGNDIVVADGRLYVNNYNGNNVQVYDAIPVASGQQPDWALGSPAVEYNTLNDLHYIQNPILCTDGQHLIASSDFDRTLWIWNSTEPAVGQTPDVAINLKTNNLFVRDNAVFDQKLILAGQKNVAVWNGIPTAPTGPAKIFNNHIGTAQFEYLNAVAYDSAFFYLGERSGKIWLWDHLPASDNDNPDLEIDLPYEPLSSLHSDGEYLTATIQNGQPYILIFKVAELQNGNLSPWKIITRDPPVPGQPPSLPLNLCASAITFNGSLAIANTNNHNVLLWENIEDAGDPASAIVLGQAQMGNTQPGLGDQYLTLPQSLCAVGNHLWVGEVKFSSRILRYSYTASTNTQETGQTTLNLWPNPASDLLHIDSPASIQTVRVFDAQGSLRGTFSEQPISVKGWPSGLYFLQISTEKGPVCKNFIKN
ncbi:MAG: T9SS type A sorting domain-containing protein [Saprospiraceae bacterium]